MFLRVWVNAREHRGQNERMTNRFETLSRKRTGAVDRARVHQEITEVCTLFSLILTRFIYILFSFCTGELHEPREIYARFTCTVSCDLTLRAYIIHLRVHIVRTFFPRRRWSPWPPFLFLFVNGSAIADAGPRFSRRETCRTVHAPDDFRINGSFYQIPNLHGIYFEHLTIA